jgi:hypothetical protein
MLGFGDCSPTFGPLESGAIVKLHVVIKKAYNTSTLQVWYISTDVCFILFHVEFEGGLSISVLENRATCHKNLQLEIEMFQKVQMFLKTAVHSIFTSCPFRTLAVRCSRPGLGTPAYVRVSKMTGTYSKE